MINQSNCLHYFINCKAILYCSYCKLCGIMKYENTISTKPRAYDKKTDLEPYEVFKRIADNHRKFNINYKIKQHKEYLKRRKNIIEFLKNLSLIQNFDQESYFQAVFYLDKIIFQNNFLENIEDENITQMSLFTRYNKNEKKFIDYGYIFTCLAIGCFNISNKFIQKIPTNFDEKILHSLGFSYNFTQRNIQEFEIFCLNILNYNLIDSCSYTILNLILSNGILDADEANAKNPENLDLLYNIIFQINSFFVTDNRYVDFSDLEISISIISFACKILNYGSWKEKIFKFYYSRNLENRACFFVIDRLFSLNEKYTNDKKINSSNNCIIDSFISSNFHLDNGNDKSKPEINTNKNNKIFENNNHNNFKKVYSLHMGKNYQGSNYNFFMKSNILNDFYENNNNYSKKETKDFIKFPNSNREYLENMDFFNNPFTQKENFFHGNIANSKSDFLEKYHNNFFKCQNVKNNIQNNNFLNAQNNNIDLISDFSTESRNINNFSSVSNYYFPQSNLINGGIIKINNFNNSNLKIPNFNYFKIFKNDFLQENYNQDNSTNSDQIKRINDYLQNQENQSLNNNGEFNLFNNQSIFNWNNKINNNDNQANIRNKLNLEIIENSDDNFLKKSINEHNNGKDLNISNHSTDSHNHKSKTSSDSTKIEESPQIENSGNLNNIYDKKSKNIMKFFDSDNRKILDGEVINGNSIKY